ncbi:plasmolipin-like [Liolophura sinensis]|uniref:plasmolipin-like n=1 Tax=Liolophura sinensis TaxID=3198878 RepID=UPI003159718C
MATTTTSTVTFCTYDAGYLRSVPGILKIVEAVLCLIAFICAIIYTRHWTALGLGWVQFVTISACIAVMIIFFLYVFHIVDRLHAVFALLVLIFYFVYDIFLLVAGILAAVQASQYGGRYYGSETVAAAAAFVFFALIAFLIDTYLQFKGWRIVRTSGGSSSTTTRTTVTTHSSYVTKA